MDWAVIMAFAGGANMTYLNILNIALTVCLKGKLFFCIFVVYITASKKSQLPFFPSMMLKL